MISHGRAVFLHAHSLFHSLLSGPAKLAGVTSAAVTCVSDWADPLPEPAGRVDSANAITKAWHRIVTQDNWRAVAVTVLGNVKVDIIYFFFSPKGQTEFDPPPPPLWTCQCFFLFFF